MKLKEILKDFSLALSFIAGMVIFLNFPHLATLVIFISVVMVIFGLAMLISPRKSPKILGILELVVLLMEKRKHGHIAAKIIRLVGSGLVATGLLFIVFVYNRIYPFTNSLNIVVATLLVLIIFAIGESYLISSYKKKKMRK